MLKSCSGVSIGISGTMLERVDTFKYLGITTEWSGQPSGVLNKAAKTIVDLPMYASSTD